MYFNKLPVAADGCLQRDHTQRTSILEGHKMLWCLSNITLLIHGPPLFLSSPKFSVDHSFCSKAPPNFKSKQVNPRLYINPYAELGAVKWHISVRGENCRKKVMENGKP